MNDPMTPQDTSPEDWQRVEQQVRETITKEEDAMTQEQQDERCAMCGHGYHDKQGCKWEKRVPGGKQWCSCHWDEAVPEDRLQEAINARLAHADAAQGEGAWTRARLNDLAHKRTGYRSLGSVIAVALEELNAQAAALRASEAARQAAEASKAEVQRQRNDLAEQLGRLTEYITASGGHYCDGMSVAWLDAQHAIDKQHEAEARVEALTAALRKAAYAAHTYACMTNTELPKYQDFETCPEPECVEWRSLTSPANTGEQEAH